MGFLGVYDMVCPIMNKPNNFQLCLDKNCMFYSTDNVECAITGIANNLQALIPDDEPL